MAGYADAGYAESLAEFGEPRPLPRSGGWLLRRPVPGAAGHDFMGPYPLFACRDWARLGEDLEELEGDGPSVVLVADPLGDVDLADLRDAFPDLVLAFKGHHVRELDRPASMPAHHRRHVRRSAAAVEVEVCRDPARHLDDWTRLYAGLVERRRLVGIRAFSRTAFERQLGLAGVVAVRAERAGRTVGMALWFEDAPNAHYHLAAYSEEGYDVSASYAIFDVAMAHLRGRGVRRVDLGASAGGATGGDGLARFKAGWANAELPAYLCGRVLDRATYDRLAAGRGGDWFPAYRAAERDLAG